MNEVYDQARTEALIAAKAAKGQASSDARREPKLKFGPVSEEAPRPDPAAVELLPKRITARERRAARRAERNGSGPFVSV